MIDRAIFALPGIKKILCLLAASAALQALVLVGQAWSLSSVVTNLWNAGVLYDQLLGIGIFFLCFFGKQIIVSWQDSFLDRYAYEQADSLRHDLLEKVFVSQSETVQAEGTGSVTTAVVEGIDQVETYFRLILPKMTGILIIPLILLITVFTLDWVSGLILMIIFPFVILYMVILGHTAKDEAAKQHKTFQLLSNHFIDSLRGIDTLKLFGVSKQHGESIFTVSERFRKATMKTLRVATLSGFVLDLFSTLSLAAVSIMLGLRLIDGSLEFFPALTVLVLSPEYFRPIREFASDYHASLDGKNALSSILKLIEAPVVESPQKALPAWSDDSSFSVTDIGYSYPDFKALHDISFEAQGFTKIGIVGMSGSGKSTLIDLLGGFRAPDEGVTCIECESVVDFNQHDWQKQIIYIPQDPYIFHASLKDNIAFYHPDASDQEIAEAVRIVGLESLIEELPEGINTRIGEGARALSGGQAQRIALARAFLDKSRKILLFDEPTAHLDIETEMELKEKMLPLMEKHLVFFATHRLHWMHDMDTILVMDSGTIVERGSLRELSDQNSTFTHLASLMNRGEQ